MPHDVYISWSWIEWNEKYTWKRDILPQLKDNDIYEKQLERCVYVIRSNSLFAIRYPKGISPTLYILVKVISKIE